MIFDSTKPARTRGRKRARTYPNGSCAVIILADLGRSPLRGSDGDMARYLYGGDTIIALVLDDQFGWQVHTYRVDGQFRAEGESSLDLVNV